MPTAARRTRPTVWDGLVALLVLLCAAALLLLFRSGAAQRLTATIYLDGAAVRTVDLTALDAPLEFSLEGCPYPLTIRAEPGRIRVEESVCPGEDCVRTGWISRAGGQIICLPNRVVISITGRAAPDVDAVASQEGAL